MSRIGTQGFDPRANAGSGASPLVQALQAQANERQADEQLALQREQLDLEGKRLAQSAEQRLLDRENAVALEKMRQDGFLQMQKHESEEKAKDREQTQALTDQQIAHEQSQLKFRMETEAKLARQADEAAKQRLVMDFQLREAMQRGDTKRAGELQLQRERFNTERKAHDRRAQQLAHGTVLMSQKSDRMNKEFMQMVNDQAVANYKIWNETIDQIGTDLESQFSIAAGEFAGTLSGATERSGVLGLLQGVNEKVRNSIFGRPGIEDAAGGGFFNKNSGALSAATGKTPMTGQEIQEAKVIQAELKAARGQIIGQVIEDVVDRFSNEKTGKMAQGESAKGLMKQVLGDILTVAELQSGDHPVSDQLKKSIQSNMNDLERRGIPAMQIQAMIGAFDQFADHQSDAIRVSLSGMSRKDRDGVAGLGQQVLLDAVSVLGSMNRAADFVGLRADEPRDPADIARTFADNYVSLNDFISPDRRADTIKEYQEVFGTKDTNKLLERLGAFQQESETFVDQFGFGDLETARGIDEEIFGDMQGLDLDQLDAAQELLERQAAEPSVLEGFLEPGAHSGRQVNKLPDWM